MKPPCRSCRRCYNGRSLTGLSRSTLVSDRTTQRSLSGHPGERYSRLAHLRCCSARNSSRSLPSRAGLLRFHKMLPEFVWDASVLEGNLFTFPEVKCSGMALPQIIPTTAVPTLTREKITLAGPSVTSLIRAQLLHCIIPPCPLTLTKSPDIVMMHRQ